MPKHEDECDLEYFTREQAITIAQQQAIRDLSESEFVISYVAFVSDFEDFCWCEFHLEALHGWVLSCRVLAQEERASDEQITDERIRETALSGNVLLAIRLYRSKYNVGLAEEKAGVNQMLYESQ